MGAKGGAYFFKTMTTIEPNVVPSGIYNQAQTAEALGVCRHTVARYEKAGHLLFKVRKVGGRKVTTGAQILKCWKSTYL